MCNIFLSYDTEEKANSELFIPLFLSQKHMVQLPFSSWKVAWQAMLELIIMKLNQLLLDFSSQYSLPRNYWLVTVLVFQYQVSHIH